MKSTTLQRVVTVAPLVPIILWMIFGSQPWTFTVLIVAALAVSGFELLQMHCPDDPWTCGWGAFSAAIVGVAVIVGGGLAPLVAAFAIVVLGALVAALIDTNDLSKASLRFAWLIGAPVYIGVPLSTLALLHRDFPQGPEWALLTLALAWLSDTFAYFAGRRFGRVKLMPRLSPSKTVEGAIGGLVGSIVSAVVMSHWIDVLHLGDAVALGIVAGTLGQAGDFLESLVKRGSGVKDSGGILPGHGGILDRIDALLYTSVVTWLFAMHVAA